MSSKPQLVFVPGAWHTPEAFSLITPLLKSAGYTVHSRQLPAVGNPNPPQDLSEDIAAVRDLVTEAIGTGNDVVVFPHSWGGIVVGSALVGLGKKEREAQGEKGGVVRTGYICSFLVPKGINPIQSMDADWWTVEGNQILLKPSGQQVLYSDLPIPDQEKWFAKVQTHAFHAQQGNATAECWLDIPTSYLLCEDDQAIPCSAQEAMTEMVRQRGGDIEVERIKSGHSPFLSQPENTVAWVRKVAGEKV
ncbi:alpha/beta-hydrolase [Massarina eburnea CBS 473.64]|uniref:Alpha/beta-hydrolase n=1 Tax=Massarina eburnea CBS 473.64 TaxID=1395130 RepID=A0A6A6S387_9PLEO|nr:alpha/beta-hydrolase [Massarina eburnea CBS 473.64]